MKDLHDSLISVLYGLALSEFFFVPMQTTALKRSESAETSSPGRAVPLVLMLFVTFSVSSMGFLMLSLL